jgi:hypothetical protein
MINMSEVTALVNKTPDMLGQYILPGAGFVAGFAAGSADLSGLARQYVPANLLPVDVKTQNLIIDLGVIAAEVAVGSWCWSKGGLLFRPLGAACFGASIKQGLTMLASAKGGA